MEQQQPRGRGRARGRSRGQPSTGAVPRPGPQPMVPRQSAWGPGPSAAPAPALQPPAGAWGPRAQIQQQPQIRAPAPIQQRSSHGRASCHGDDDARSPGTQEVRGAPAAPSAAGGDAGVAHSGRGNLRGRRQISDFATYFRTKPQQVQSKQGK